MSTDKKRTRWTAGAVGVTLAALLVGATMTHVAAQGRGPWHERGHGGRPGPGFGPGRGALGLGPIMQLESLTDAQREQLRALAQSRREEAPSLMRQLDEARRALMASAESGAVDETKAAELGAAASALALMRARLHADAFAILTPEQKAELSAQRDRMRQWWQSRPNGDGPGGRRRNRPGQ